MPDNNGQNKVWLDANGKVLIDTNNGVYYTPECCCVRGCFQQYEASCTAGLDGWSDWTPPVMREYTCTNPGALPDIGTWRYEGKTAYQWVPAGSCGADCAEPVGVEPPEGLCTCIIASQTQARGIASYRVSIPYIYCRMATFLMTTVEGSTFPIGLTNYVSSILRLDELRDFPYNNYDFLSMRIGYLQIQQLISYNYSVDRYGLPLNFYSPADMAGYQQWVEQQSMYTHYQIWQKYSNSTYIPLSYTRIPGYTFMYRNVYEYQNNVYSLTTITDTISVTQAGQVVELTKASVVSAPYIAEAMTVVSSYAKTWPLLTMAFGNNQWGSQHLVLNSYGNEHVIFSCYRHVCGVTSLPQNIPVSPILMAEESIILDGSPEWTYYAAIATDYPIDKINKCQTDAALDCMLNSFPQMKTTMTFISPEIWPASGATAAYSYTRCVSLCAAVFTYCWGRACDADGTVGDISGVLCEPVAYMESAVPYPSGARLYHNYKAAHEQDDAMNQQQVAYRSFNSDTDGHVYVVEYLGISNFPSWYISGQCAVSLDPNLWEVPRIDLTDNAFYCFTSKQCALNSLSMLCGADRPVAIVMTGDPQLAVTYYQEYPAVVCESNWKTVASVSPVTHMAFPKWAQEVPLLNTYVVTQFTAQQDTAGNFEVTDLIRDLANSEFCPDIPITMQLFMVDHWGLETAIVTSTYRYESDGFHVSTIYCAHLSDSYAYNAASSKVFSPTWLGNLPDTRCMSGSFHYNVPTGHAVGVVAYQKKPFCEAQDACAVAEANRYITANILHAMGFGDDYAWGKHSANYCITLHAGARIDLVYTEYMSDIQTREFSGGLSSYASRNTSVHLSYVASEDTVISDVFPYLVGNSYVSRYERSRDTCGGIAEFSSHFTYVCSSRVYRALGAMGDCYPTCAMAENNTLIGDTTLKATNNNSFCTYNTEAFCRDRNTTMHCPTTMLFYQADKYTSEYVFSRYGKYADCYWSEEVSRSLCITITG